tara:strand:+ start:251 stop:598 length:348 start_codon:yes stop_codon:yes gene_type:complete
MAIQVINMKYSNEQVIAEVGEVYHDEKSKENGEKPICLAFTDPYTLHVVNETEEGYNINFKKWNPFTDDRQFNVGFDLIGIISGAKTAVQNAYEQKILADSQPLEEGNEETTTTE